MYLDLTCPLELLSAELLRDDRRKVRAYLLMNNLAPHRIARIEGEIHWIQEASAERASMPFAVDGLRAGAGERFKLQLSTDQMPDADDVELVIHRIGYGGGGKDWVGNPEDLIRIEEPLPPAPAELNKLVSLAGQDARAFPLKTSGYWICVCGRPNRIGSDCARCGRGMEHVLENFNRKTVLAGGPAQVVLDSLPGKAEPEIPAFLFEREGASRPKDSRQSLREELEELRAQYVSQRNLLIRRSIFLGITVVLVLLVIYAFEWLGAKQQQAKDIRPPVRVEESGVSGTSIADPTQASSGVAPARPGT